MGAPQTNGHINGENKAQVLIIGYANAVCATSNTPLTGLYSLPIAVLAIEAVLSASRYRMH